MYLPTHFPVLMAIGGACQVVTAGVSKSSAQGTSWVRKLDCFCTTTLKLNRATSQFSSWPAVDCAATMHGAAVCGCTDSDLQTQSKRPPKSMRHSKRSILEFLSTVTFLLSQSSSAAHDTVFAPSPPTKFIVDTHRVVCFQKFALPRLEF